MTMTEISYEWEVLREYISDIHIISVSPSSPASLSFLVEWEAVESRNAIEVFLKHHSIYDPFTVEVMGLIARHQVGRNLTARKELEYILNMVKSHGVLPITSVERANAAKPITPPIKFFGINGALSEGEKRFVDLYLQ